MPEIRPLALYNGRTEQMRAGDHAPGVPPGTVVELPAGTPDGDWLPMDGRYVTIAAYPALAALPDPAFEFGELRYTKADATLYGVAWSGSLLCAVGDLGTILTSPDGVTWTARTSGTTQILYGVAWSGSLFCAVGGSGTILTSPDGVTWTARTSGTTQTLYGVVWSGSLFCAVGGSGTILTSLDGVIWTARTSGTTQILYGVAWSGSLFCAVGGSGTILTSPDGVTWTARTSGTTQTLFGVAWSGSLFCAVGTGDIILTSPDGVTWTARLSGATFSLRYVPLVAANRVWVTSGSGQLLSFPLPVAGQRVLPYRDVMTAGVTRAYMRVR